MRYGSSNEILQGRFVDLVPFMEVYRPGFLSLKPGIEELVAIRKTRALEKVHFHISLESTYS